MTGWIKLHRKMLEWEWYKDANTFRLFMHFLLKANHEPKKWQGFLIQRGQFISGRKELSYELGISEQCIRTSLNRLKSTNEVTIKTTNKFSIFTVINYNLYQDTESTNQQANQQLTINQPTTNQQLTTTKELKNDNNENNERSKKDFTPPSENEVIEYFNENGYTKQSAITAFEYYQIPMIERNGKVWKDSKGNTVKNWKQKMRGVWFKEENKISQNGKSKKGQADSTRLAEALRESDPNWNIY